MPIHLRSSFILSLALLGVCNPGPVQAQTAVSVAAQIGDFHVAVSNYYRVPEREIVVIRERRISDDDLPVVFFIARHAGVSPARIVDLRLRGLSWWDISVRFGLSRDIYYVPVAVAPGPPYGKAYGHYKKSGGARSALADDDVVNLVHLRFISEHYRIPPERVIEIRGQRGSLQSVHQEVSRGRSGRDAAGARKVSDDRSQSNAHKESNGSGNQKASNGSKGQKASNGRKGEKADN